MGYKHLKISGLKMYNYMGISINDMENSPSPPQESIPKRKQKDLYLLILHL